MFSTTGHWLFRLGMILTVASLVFMLFGAPYGLGALFFAAGVETVDAVSCYSTRGKLVDGAAALALWAILLGALTGHYFVGAQIVLAYAALSVLSDALSSRAYRARYHAF